MALAIRPDGAEAVVFPKGKHFTLDEMYSIIGCDMVQMVVLDDGRLMWCDEEAKLKRELPAVNHVATWLYWKAGGIPGSPVLGTVLITEEGETE